MNFCDATDSTTESISCSLITVTCQNVGGKFEIEWNEGLSINVSWDECRHDGQCGLEVRIDENLATKSFHHLKKGYRFVFQLLPSFPPALYFPVAISLIAIISYPVPRLTSPFCQFFTNFKIDAFILVLQLSEVTLPFEIYV